MKCPCRSLSSNEREDPNVQCKCVVLLVTLYGISGERLRISDNVCQWLRHDPCSKGLYERESAAIKSRYAIFRLHSVDINRPMQFGHSLLYGQSPSTECRFCLANILFQSTYHIAYVNIARIYRVEFSLPIHSCG